MILQVANGKFKHARIQSRTRVTSY